MVNLQTKSYQIAFESFGSFAMDQPVKDRMNYRTMAMEAATGPDAGMVVDRLYQSVMSRANINFGKIPDSNGDLTKFTKYKTIAEMLSLLDRQMADKPFKELKLTHDLHDCIIKCREDFVYGFKTDSQFLKTTYDTMVYSLCEMLNLCAVIYIDSLKAGAEGHSFQPDDYSNLLLVQNVKKFVDMVTSGEWTNMMRSIRKDARNLLDVMIGSNGGKEQSMLGLFGNGIAAGGILGGVVAASSKDAHALAETAAKANNAARVMKNGSAVPIMRDYAKAAVNLPRKLFNAAGVPGKIVIVVVAIIATLILLRSLLCIFFKGVYKLNDMLEDSERLLKAHMDINTDPSGTYKGLEAQKKMYDKLSSLRDGIRRHILAEDAHGKKELKESNQTEMTKDAFVAPDPADAGAGVDDADFAIT